LFSVFFSPFVKDFLCLAIKDLLTQRKTCASYQNFDGTFFANVIADVDVIMIKDG